MITLPVYVRSSGTEAGVTSSSTSEITMIVPPRGLIKRIRVSKTAGGATTAVVQVLEAASGTGTNVAIAYATAASIDNEESIFYEVPETSPGVGSLFISVVPDTGTNTYIARLDIEKVA